MSMIKELRDRQAKIVSEARERNDLINKNTDEARAKELEAQHDAAMAEYDRLDAQIKREEHLASLEARHEELRAKQRPGLGDKAAPAADQGKALSYREAFYAMLQRGGHAHPHESIPRPPGQE